MSLQGSFLSVLVCSPSMEQCPQHRDASCQRCNPAFKYIPIYFIFIYVCIYMYIYKRRSSYVQVDKPAAPLACLHRKRNLQEEKKMQKDSKIGKKKKTRTQEMEVIMIAANDMGTFASSLQGRRKARQQQFRGCCDPKKKMLSRQSRVVAQTKKVALLHKSKTVWKEKNICISVHIF